jgi:hypothetical protein
MWGNYILNKMKGFSCIAVNTTMKVKPSPTCSSVYLSCICHVFVAGVNNLSGGSCNSIMGVLCGRDITPRPRSRARECCLLSEERNPTD